MSDASVANQARVRGRIKFFDTRKGFGFIKPDDGSRDVFLSINRIDKEAFRPDKDQPCSFVTEVGAKGPFAKDVRLL